MFRILCGPSSGSTELCLTEITRSGSQIFCRVLGRCLYFILQLKITLPNTDQAHDKISVNHNKYSQSSTALYSLMMDHIRSETCRSDF
jgi:hypothetical protein